MARDETKMKEAAASSMSPGGATPSPGEPLASDAQRVINPNRSLLAKRLFDLAASCVGLALLWSIFLVVAMTIKREDGGPVFFRQERVGQHGRPFRIWKFRTMVENTERAGAQVTAAGDPRITRIGRFLRRTKLDEMPQLINVVLGEMSLVGPRPEVPKYVRHYTPAQSRILELAPGITDAASLRFVDEEALLAQQPDPEAYYRSVLIDEKINENLRYASRATILSDLRLILATVSRMGRHRP